MCKRKSGRLTRSMANIANSLSAGYDAVMPVPEHPVEVPQAAIRAAEVTAETILLDRMTGAVGEVPDQATVDIVKVHNG